MNKGKAKSIRIYTDGACSGNPGPGGWAVVWCDGDEIQDRRGGEKQTTNNRMELIAVVEAIKWVLKSEKSNLYTIYSDSAYVHNAITKGWIQAWQARGWKTTAGDPVKNQELWQELDALLRVCNHMLMFCKVKGHNGLPMNEYADKIAKSEVVKQQYKIREDARCK